MIKDYDRAYETLRLQKGSPPSEIQANWKYWAAMLCPDNFTGALKARAENELKELNVARDDLLAWWTRNNTPPPSRSSDQASQGSPPAYEEKAPEPPGSEETWQQKAYREWKEAHKQSKDSPPPPPPPKAAPSKPFGPAPYNKSWRHHLYDLADSSRSDAVIPALASIILIWGAPFVIVFLLFYLCGPSLSAILAFAISIPFWIQTHADWTIYKIQVSPYIQPSPLPAQEALAKVSRLIEANSFVQKKWQLVIADLAPEDNILAKNWLMSFTEDETKKYRIQLNVRVMETAPGLKSAISYWFDVDGVPNWSAPVAKVLKATDETLWRGLQ